MENRSRFICAFKSIFSVVAGFFRTSGNFPVIKIADSRNLAEGKLKNTLFIDFTVLLSRMGDYLGCKGELPWAC